MFVPPPFVCVIRSIPKRLLGPPTLAQPATRRSAISTKLVRSDCREGGWRATSACIRSLTRYRIDVTPSPRKQFFTSREFITSAGVSYGEWFSGQSNFNARGSTALRRRFRSRAASDTIPVLVTINLFAIIGSNKIIIGFLYIQMELSAFVAVLLSVGTAGWTAWLSQLYRQRRAGQNGAVISSIEISSFPSQFYLTV